MNVPAFAQPYVSEFQSKGTVSGDFNRFELNKEDAERTLDNLKDEFTRWKGLDETDADLAKGKPGEVVVAGYAEGEQTTATFSGTTQSGELTVFENEPTTHYGASYFSTTKFQPQSADRLDLMDFMGEYSRPSLLHVDRQLSSDGPISLGGGPVTVTLKDHATGGYILHANG